MKEKDFMRQVINVARLNRWLCAHFGASVRVVGAGASKRFVGDRDAAGFPDLVMTRKGRLIVAELKGDSGWSLTPAQKEWLEALALTEAEVYMWKPKDWPEIERVLR